MVVPARRGVTRGAPSATRRRTSSVRSGPGPGGARRSSRRTRLNPLSVGATRDSPSSASAVEFLRNERRHRASSRRWDNYSAEHVDGLSTSRRPRKRPADAYLTVHAALLAREPGTSDRDWLEIPTLTPVALRILSALECTVADVPTAGSPPSLEGLRACLQRCRRRHPPEPGRRPRAYLPRTSGPSAPRAEALAELAVPSFDARTLAVDRRGERRARPSEGFKSCGPARGDGTRRQTSHEEVWSSSRLARLDGWTTVTDRRRQKRSRFASIASQRGGRTDRRAHRPVDIPDAGLAAGAAISAAGLAGALGWCVWLVIARRRLPNAEDGDDQDPHRTS